VSEPRLQAPLLIQVMEAGCRNDTSSSSR